MARNGIRCVTLLTAIWGSLEIMLFGGVIFGWHNIVYIYKDLGYFSHLCPIFNVTEMINNTAQMTTPFTESAYIDYNVTLKAPDTMLSCEQRYNLATLHKRSNCRGQNEQFNLIFALATFLTGIASFPNGFIYDRFGTRKCRIISMVCVLTGLMCLIFSTPETSMLLYPGFILLCYGGYLILITNLQISSLVPRYRSMLIASYCGSYDVSSTIFLFFKLAYENNNISPNSCFICLAVVFCLIVSFSTFCLLPKDRLPWPHPPNYKYQPSICQSLNRKKSVQLNTSVSVLKEIKIDQFGSVMIIDQDMLMSQEFGNGDALVISRHNNVSTDIEIDQEALFTTSKQSIENPEKISEMKPVVPQNTTDTTFKKLIMSPLFLWDLVWMCIHRLRSWMFIGVFNPWMTRLACGDQSIVSHYTSFLSSTQFIGIFTAAMSGCLMDRKVKQNYNNNRRFERIHASMASFLLNCTVAMFLSVGMTIPVLQVQYVTCLLHTFHRSFLYGPNSAFIANAFSMEHFGKLIGMSLTVSGIFGMLQYPLFLLIQGPLNNDPLVVNVLICVMVLCTYLHPAYIWYYLRKKIKKNNMQVKTDE